jgi:hypothetical protein
MAWGDRIDEQYDKMRNVIGAERKNLIQIMESRVYVD